MEFSAQQIAAFTQGDIIGDATRQVNDVSSIEDGRESTLSFITDRKYLHLLSTTKASVILLSRAFYSADMSVSATLILVDNARQAMGQLLKAVEQVLRPVKHGIEQPVFIHPTAIVPEDAYIGAFAYIGEGVTLGRNVQIYPQAYIGDNAKIGDNTVIYAGAKIYDHCQVGKNCILHSGSVIGADGFGFEPDEAGIQHKIPQIGIVCIDDDVEIGANTTIDRAMMGVTHICRNTKLDNLVQLGHNVQVGESTIMCAQVGVAGSTTVGSHCVLAGQVGVSGHISLADKVICGAQSGVASTIRQEGVYMGSPAIDATTWKRAAIVFKHLPEMYREHNELIKKTQE